MKKTSQGGFAMRSLCNNWEFVPNWFAGFETGEGQGSSARLPHTVQELPLHSLLRGLP